MAIHDIDGIIKHLEKGAEDELAYLEETGAEFFTTSQLLRLYGQWEIKYRLFKKLHFILIRIVAISPLWVGLYYAFRALDWGVLALTSLSLFPLSFLLFFAGMLFSYRFFKSKGYLDRIGEMIRQELTERSIHRHL